MISTDFYWLRVAFTFSRSFSVNVKWGIKDGGQSSISHSYAESLLDSAFVEGFNFLSLLLLLPTQLLLFSPTERDTRNKHVSIGDPITSFKLCLYTALWNSSCSTRSSTGGKSSLGQANVCPRALFSPSIPDLFSFRFNSTDFSFDCDQLLHLTKVKLVSFFLLRCYFLVVGSASAFYFHGTLLLLKQMSKWIYKTLWNKDAKVINSNQMFCVGRFSQIEINVFPEILHIGVIVFRAVKSGGHLGQLTLAQLRGPWRSHQ